MLTLLAETAVIADDSTITLALAVTLVGGAVGAALWVASFRADFHARVDRVVNKVDGLDSRLVGLETKQGEHASKLREMELEEARRAGVEEGRRSKTRVPRG